MMKHANRRCRLGFSLIELLVVVSLIIMLIALVLPSLGKVRSSARMAICTNNLHQIHMAYARREVDVKSKVKSRLAGFGWPGELSPYLNEQSTFVCPEGRGEGDTPIEAYVLQVIAGGNHIYDMELAPGPLTFYVDQNTTDQFIIEEIDPDLTPSEISNIPANGFRLYFEDLRPHGGDRDFRDVVLEIVETPEGTSIEYVQDAAGYTFNLVNSVTGEIIWQNMDNGGQTPPGTKEVVDGGAASYGINEAVGRFHKSSKSDELVFMMDYQQSVVNWGMIIDLDTWDDWLNDYDEFRFARHDGLVNAMFRTGDVRTSLDPDQFDPILPENVDRWWRALDPPTTP